MLHATFDDDEDEETKHTELEEMWLESANDENKIDNEQSGIDDNVQSQLQALVDQNGDRDDEDGNDNDNDDNDLSVSEHLNFDDDEIMMLEDIYSSGNEDVP